MPKFRSSTFSKSGVAGESERDKLTNTITSLYDSMAAQFQPGGTYTKGIEEQLARRKKGAMASGMQSLVSSGMAGTTQAAGLGSKFEEEVGMPTMAAAETSRIGKLTEAMMGKAGFMQQLLQDTPRRSTTIIPAKMSEGFLERHYRESKEAKDRKALKTTAAKPAATTHTGRRMFQPFGGSGYGATTNVGSSGDVNAFFAR